jgi:5-hydroxyisourate hydrolase-like protein (transthyretin family)
MKPSGFWFALALFMGMTSQAARNTADFAGTILHSGKPLDGVHVTLTVVGDEHPSVIYGAMSNAQGRFSISDLPAGVYSIALEKRGFIFVLSGTKGPGATGEVRLKADGRRTDVVLSMKPRVIIAGRVLDHYGDPVKDVAVSALPTDPEKATAGLWRVVTNDRGEFRISVLPGNYYVQGTLTFFSDDAYPGQSDELDIKSYAPTYYPGSLREQDASVVKAVPGRANNLEIRLQRQPTFMILGKVKGLPPDARMISIHSDSDIAGQQTHQIHVPRFFDGPSLEETSFDIGPYQAGTYRIYALCGTGRQEFQSQVTEVTVTNPFPNVELQLVPGNEVGGVIRIAAGSPSGSLQTKGLTMELNPVDNDLFERMRTVQSAADGSFKIKDVFDERYSFRLVPLPEDSFIQSASINGVPVKGGVLDFSEGAAGATVRIIVNANGARITGKVDEGKGRSPIEGASVLLFPDGDAMQADEARLAFAGADGSYSFRGLAPRRYRLLATDHGMTGPSLIEAWILREGATAAVVEVKEGEKIVKDIHLTNEKADGPEK